MIQNSEISAIFRNISKLLQIRGDATFRSRSYDKAADTIDTLTVDVRQLVTAGTLQDLPGIGKTLLEKTEEILETGSCEFYDRLVDEMGIEVLDLLELRGVGSKTASRLYSELGIKNLTDLSEALADGKLQRMKGLGKKTIANITESLRFLNTYSGTRLLHQTLNLAENLSRIFKNCDAIQQYQFTGDLRRREEVCRSLSIVVECAKDIHTTQRTLLERLSEHGIDAHEQPAETPAQQTQPQIQCCIDGDFPVAIYISDTTGYTPTRFITTATEAHLSEFEKQSPDSRYDIDTPTETAIYEKIGVPGLYIEPEIRQDGDAIIAALQDRLPTLIQRSDLRGDLHMHTNYSDGANTLSDMVNEAKTRGLEYIAITDHSVSSTVANGLDRNRLLSQIAQIRELDAATDDITVLAGSEVDIRKEGSLDFPDEILAQLDIVIASVHSYFSLSEAEMTRRIVRAIENPFVKIIGHPTGRLLGSRPMYPVNLDEIIDAAAANRTALEINGSPSRLDLGPEYVRKAKAAGVLLAVNTDAHTTAQFEHRQFGINVARRGWLAKSDVINTYPLQKLKETIGNH